MIASRRIGSATVFALTDGETTLPLLRTEAFPAATAEQWARAEAFDPRATALEGQWLLQFRAFVIRLDDGQVILVDAGIGAADSAAASWAPTPGRLPEELAAAGFAPDDVSRVVLTHLLAITGDLLVHALQVVAPEVGYQHEMDQDKARQSRTSLMAEVARRGGELATPHLTEPFVKIS